MDTLLWFKEHAGVVADDRLKVGDSLIDREASGLGLFVDGEVPRNGVIELLRIPKSITFDINTIQSIVNDEWQYIYGANCTRTKDEVARWFKKFSSYLQENRLLDSILSETNIITFYFILFDEIQHELELPAMLKYYLNNVLLTTNIGQRNITSAEFQQYFDSITPLSNIIKHYSSLFPSSNNIEQIYFAVVSRVLEIPASIDESEDFVVNTTLVPVLDFANHDNRRKNAWYDIDRKTNDVLLIYDCQSSDKEVLISYSPGEEINNFLTVYGFIPSTASYYNLSFDREFLNKDKIGLFYKWFDINPVLQLIKYDKNWYISDDLQLTELLIPFSNKSNNGSIIWEFNKNCYKDFSYIHTLTKNNKKTINQYRKYISETQQNRRIDSMRLPQLAWSLIYTSNDVSSKLRPSKDIAIDILFSGGVNAELFESFMSFLKEYIQWRIKKLNIILNKDRNGSFHQFVVAELDVLNTLKNSKLDNNIFWSELDIKRKECPLPPGLNEFQYIEFKANSLETEIELDDEFNPDEYTDNIDFEIERYSEFFELVDNGQIQYLRF